MPNGTQIPDEDSPEDPDLDDDGGAAAPSELAEPLDAVRLSPYAITSFVVALIGLYLADGSMFAFARSISWEGVTSGLIPVAAAIVSLWLVSKANEEIYVAEGRLGGVGFARAGRALAIVTLVLIAASIILRFLAENPGWIDLDLNTIGTLRRLIA